MLRFYRSKLSPGTFNILISLVVVIAITGYFYWVKFDGNITGFFRIGSILPLSPYLNPETTLIYQGEIGYDGQQFLSLALDPFLQNSETIESLDHPIYRYRRILYPLISYCLGLGNHTLIPYIMVGINVASIIAIVALVNLYFRSNRQSQYQALLTLCIPGIWIVLSLGTADLLSSIFLIGAFYCYRQEKPIGTAICISLGCLTRETLLLMWLSLLIVSWLHKKRQQIKCLLWALLPPIFWTVYISFLNLPGKVRVKDNFGYPFIGIFNKLKLLVTTGLNGRTLFEAYTFIVLLMIIAAIFLIYVKNRQENALIGISNSFYSLMFICSSITILGYYLDYLRVFMDLYLLLLLMFNSGQFPWKTILLSASGLSSLAFLMLHS